MEWAYDSAKRNRTLGKLSMPSLLTFVPCRSVIIAKDETVSIIGILSDMALHGLPPIVPDDAAIPYEWSLFAIWELSAADQQKAWEQRIRLIDQHQQTVRIDSIAAFHVEQGKEIHRMIATIPFFPIVNAGKYRLEVSFREYGTEAWQVVQTYPFSVSRV